MELDSDPSVQPSPISTTNRFVDACHISEFSEEHNISIIDYDSVAELYDVYAQTDYDHAFFMQEVARHGKRVLELTSGTGRLSIPLIEAGADLACVDRSRSMLDILCKKLADRNLSADVICSDVADLAFDAEFDLALLPFQSFMELIGREKQSRTLSAMYRSLKPGGRFVCTLHNPVVRRQSVDGILHLVGEFPMNDGTLVVSGCEQGGSPVVERSQFFEYYDEVGIQQWKKLLNMRFEFIEQADFQAMAEASGFRISALYGDYDYAPYQADSSPYMIWMLEKPQ